MPFSDLTSQVAVVDQLTRSLRENRVAHAYLFTGENRSDLEKAAVLLAQALNCTDNLTDPCGRCRACVQIAGLNHPEVFWIKPESKSRKIVIDQIRELERTLNQKASFGRTKVGIIVDADCLGNEAANAFLKTLEEPPSQTNLILISTQPERLLPTIISRCRRLIFSMGTDKALSSDCERRVLDQLVEFPLDGSVFNAYQLLSVLQKEIEGQKEEIEARVEAESSASKWADVADKKYLDKVDDENAARVAAERKQEVEKLIKVLYKWQHDIVMIKEGLQGGFLYFPQQISVLQERAAKLSIEDALRKMTVIENLNNKLSRTNVQESLAIEVALLRL
ncbi:MAG: hypothetical protein SGI71_06405 [Verrucomicrobiota bacterium]|nr:hypothetical protein [Verrucomicrobiota bacterium]